MSKVSLAKVAIMHSLQNFQDMNQIWLCSEDYHWWWRAYLTSGASALYLFLYAGYYLVTRIHIAKATVASAAIFFGYIAIISYGFFVLTGFTGFISCYFFVRTIYGSIKVD